MSDSLELLVQRHSLACEEAKEILLREIPEEGGVAKRIDLLRLIRSGFEAGLVAAYQANKFSLPNGVPSLGRN